VTAVALRPRRIRDVLQINSCAPVAAKSITSDL
jgi:hypothetical protein